MKLLFILFFSYCIAFANIGKISAIVGDAKIIRDNKSLIAKIGLILEEKDIIITKSNAKLQIIFKDNTIITLGKNSALDINEYIYDLKNPKHSRTNLNFFKGAFKAITGNIGKINKKKFKLRTKSSTIGIRGTVVIGNQNMVACTSGAIFVTSSGKTVLVDANEITFTKEGETPTTAQSLTSENLESLENEINPSEDTSANNNESDNESSENNEDKQEETGNDSNSSSQTNNDESDDDSSTSSSSDDTNSVSQDDTSLESSDDTSSDNQVNAEPEVSATSSTQVAENASDDNTNTSSSNTTPTEYSQSGYFLGGNNNGVAGENFVQKSSTFNAKRVENLFSFTDQQLDKKRIDAGGVLDDKDVTVSAEQTFSGFNEPGVGKYSGFPKNNNIGILSFNHTNPTLTGTYDIYADNVGEVFVGLHDGTDFDEMFITGTSGNTANLDENKVYVYREFAFLNIKKNTVTGEYQVPSLNNYVDQSEQSYEYYNPKTKSLTHYNINYLEKGAEEFVSGDTSSVVSYRNNYKYNAVTNNLDSYTHQKTDANLKVLGTDLQALAVNIDTTVYSTYDSVNQTISETHDGVGASFLDKDAMLEAKDLDTTGYTMKGFTSAFGLNESTGAKNLQNSSNPNNFTLTFKKDSTDNANKIEGTLQQNTNNILLDFSSPTDIGGNSAYYINQDLFGVSTNTGSYGSDHDLVNNTGYLVSMHDGGLDANDNPVFLDDDSSWGYWTGSFDDSGDHIYIDPHSNWVSGIIDSSTISNVLGSSTRITADYTGQVLGNVYINATNTMENILVNTDNRVSLKFEFGNSTNNLMEGDINFKTTNTSWDLYLNNVAVDDTQGSFVTTSFAGASPRLSKSNISGTDMDISSVNVRGQLYGSGSIKSVGGTFNIIDTANNKAKGIFKATKQ